MNLIIIHKKSSKVIGAQSSDDSLIRFALADEPIAGVILDGLQKSLYRCRRSFQIAQFFAKHHHDNIVFAIPKDWNISSSFNILKVVPYTESVPIDSSILGEAKQKETQDPWFVISNGRFFTQTNNKLLRKVLANVRADVVAVNIEPKLLGTQEKLRLTAEGKVAGFRRLYADYAQFTPFVSDWPHSLFVKNNVLHKLLTGCNLPQSFSTLMEKCRSNAITLRSVNIGGTVLDLETEDGLMNFCRIGISNIKNSKIAVQNSDAILHDSKLIGKVLLGRNVHFGLKTVVVGPTIIGDNVKIERGAVVNSSIIGSDVSVPRNQFIQNCIVKGPRFNWKRITQIKGKNLTSISNLKLSSRQQGHNKTFRIWPRFSYQRCFKRITDCVCAAIVLILFIPIIPFIAFAIKLTSPGPVFFKDKRQGLYGKAFNCIKFRTMALGAEKIQDKLRFVSQVDGPQFKIEDDPRISAVGRFLRETYLDEIPQFFNVLLGQMSVVGPRPSPESENTLCPFWRDARLSVRPGITGLWQVCRTRQPMKDFQEWIYYDIEYVKNMSLKMDLSVAWQTTKKLIGNFINQF